MEFEKLKLGLYDLIGVVLPGLLVISEGWILIRGWTPFVASISQLNGVVFTILVIFSFGIGNLVQELADIVIKKTTKSY